MGCLLPAPVLQEYPSKALILLQSPKPTRCAPRDSGLTQKFGNTRQTNLLTCFWIFCLRMAHPQCLRSTSGGDRDLLLCGYHIYRQGFVGGKHCSEKIQVSWTCSMCFARAQECLPLGQYSPGISGRNISCDAPVVTILKYPSTATRAQVAWS